MSVAFSNWYPADDCTGSTPGAQAFMTAAVDIFGADNWGIYSCRVPSLHAEGRAVDLGCSLRLGGKIVDRLLKADPSRLGICSIIHDQRIWSANNPNGSGMADRGSVTANHEDHVHVGLTHSAAQELTVATVRSVLGISAEGDYDAYRDDVSPGERVVGQFSSKPWSAGDDVAFVQRWIGESRAGPEDGYFGPKTTAGVRWYQDMRNITVDGFVGPQTWSEMNVR